MLGTDCLNTMHGPNLSKNDMGDGRIPCQGWNLSRQLTAALAARSQHRFLGARCEGVNAHRCH
eukprot:4261130-Pleurochrysis_carterae.AAC.3